MLIGAVPRVGVLCFSPFGASNGMAVRVRAMVEDLHALGIDLHIIAVGDGQPSSPTLGVPPGAVVTEVRPRGRAGFVTQVARVLAKVSRSLDALVIEGAMFVPAVVLARVPCPLIWDIVELETLHYRRIRRTTPGVYTRHGIWYALELWAGREASVVVAVSAAEATECQRLLPSTHGKVRVVSHRVPLPDLPGGELSNGPTPPREPTAGARARAVFVGDLAAKHNRDAANWILRDLVPRLPGGYEIVFIGPGSDALPGGNMAGSTVRGLGVVPELATVVGSGDIALAPLAAGAGVKTKMLDYLALGCRVLATPVALEGLDGAPGVKRCSLADFARAFDALARSSEPEDTRICRVEAQRSWLLAHTSPQLTRAAWRDVLRDVGLTSGPASTGSGSE